jgi:nucleoside-diphosphate-sugar epimerase
MDGLQKVIITGATGFLGKALTIKLLERGVIVYGIGRSEEKFKSLDKYDNFRKVSLNFDNYDEIERVIKDTNFDAFFHCAYRGVNGEEKKSYEIQLDNIKLACTTVLQAKKLKCKRYVFIGSVDEYEVAKQPDIHFNEPSHSCIYGASKFVSEVIGKALAYESNLEYVSALLTLTYGENNNTNILPNMLIRSSLTNAPVDLITGNDYFDMIYIDEAVNGILSVAEKGVAYESYFVGHEKLRTFKEVVYNLCEIINSKSELNFGRYPDPSFSVDYKHIDREKLRRDTGYSCDYSFKSSIIKTKEWIIESSLEALLI